MPKQEKDTAIIPSVIVQPPSHYVAVGASAGGLEAIEAFFTNMPPNSGFGFIVIQHLSPDYKSLMVELLSKKTQMSVFRAEDAMNVQANCVYLIPPKMNLTIFHGKLFLTEQDHNRGINLPIDIFLRSLAEDQAEKAIAVILSGTGSDGMRGVRAVKEFGGMVMVQTEDSARFDGMPRSAISTGLADFVLPPDKMPSQLLAFVKHPYAATNVERVENMVTDEDALLRVFALLREKCKIDFTYYKPSTVMRRIERRMTINQIDEIREYVSYLLSFPAEITALYRELLIGVTSFFRDQEAFDLLADKWLPELFRNTEKNEVRMWIAACSTGEEAYSLAILARECVESLGRAIDIKIFATDIDREAIQYAATGSYPESIAADISPRLLAKYFHRKDENFQISRKVREMVVFAQHNLIKDPPFTNIDFISCRNVLIYFQPILQRKVLEFFNFSLCSGGMMFLGSSETTGEMNEFFEFIEPKHKIYRSKGRLRHMPSDTPLLSGATDTRFREAKGMFAHARRSLRPSDEEKILERFVGAVSGEFLPLSMVVNEQLELLHVVGDTSGYFRLPEGKITNDISKMAIKELSIPLITGIQKVFRQKQELRFSNIKILFGTEVRNLELRIKLLPEKKGQEPLVAVFLIERDKGVTEIGDQAAISFDLSKEAEERLKVLEQDLQFTRENLQATIEELETSNEELQATNEELLASNEELQSTNEELQSTNEELFTVNAEYQSKIIELTELHNDVENLLSTSRIGQLLLDENLEVRRFSSRITSVFKLLENDIGRPITHISHQLIDINPVDIVQQVQKTGVTVEQEVTTIDGHIHLMRVLPYTIGPKAYSGTVLAFIDVTEARRAENELHEAQNLFVSVSNTSPALIWLAGRDKKCTWFNQPWLDFTGRTLEEELGDGWTERVHPDDLAMCMKVFITSFDAREPFSMEYRLLRHDGEYRWLLDMGHPRTNDNGEFLGYIGTCLDITERKEVEARFEVQRQMTQAIIDSLSATICVLDPAGRIVTVNKSWREFSKNYDTMFVCKWEGTNYLDICDAAQGEGAQSAHQFVLGVRAVIRGDKDFFEMEYPCDLPEGTRWFIGRVTPLKHSVDQERTVVIAHEDITSRRGNT
ncbi:chemotaxis protein CheB [Chrysiogenes arsenatis]|uniref:chemotaxis protein CheB n=1 Tax=Chrysiogenes arsenatis TaxID=309797 RepID=UPI00041D3CC7|nr:chemotaxis protein CheB [Chrysiogenes arsenatis]